MLPSSLSKDNVVKFFKRALNFSERSSIPPHLLPRLKAGYLMMETTAFDGQRVWKSYVVALAGTESRNYALYYYQNPTDKIPIGHISLSCAQVDVLEEMLMIMTKRVSWFLCAETTSEAESWASTISDAIEGTVETSPSRICSSSNEDSIINEVQSRDVPTRVLEFTALFVSTSEFRLREEVATGALSWSCMRGISWRIWLQYFPIDAPISEWIEIASKQRENYDELCLQFPIENLDSVLLNSSSTEDYDGNGENTLLQSICKDVKRTRGSMQFFREHRIQRLLVRVLYTWAQKHPDISYNQGMNELLAVIIYLLHVERFPKTNLKPGCGDSNNITVEDHVDLDDCCNLFLFSGKDSEAIPYKSSIRYVLKAITSIEYLQHDSFVLFELLMSRMAGVFSPTMAEQITSSAARSFTVSEKKIRVHRDSVEEQFAGSTLSAQLDNIHHNILSRCDPILFKHITNRLEIEPQMYLLRWVRLLMSREFKMHEVWQIWDAIFSLTSSDLSMIDYLCVAAVREFRSEILSQSDIPSVLMCLRNIRDRPVSSLVENAKLLLESVIKAAAMEAMT